ncbi:MAS20-domain-containing protein [Rhodofomes roseus]|uniref:MAS20-domain-containing protein n=1 Tax=Rhodofomes roseus TaxID=34475 RepID=A0ABQ8KXS9_9APHY|nr:MAS20-domain-containing protein [Rhodofomes roseus]KAH9844112.1 MAS20-domain-containing protein [Rhodofomes roseus]
MSSRVSTVLTVAGVTALGGLVAYAVYFDYRRRTDGDFRKRLRKDKKKVKNATQSQAGEASASGVGPEELRAALDKVRDEELPPDPEAKEQYFMTHVGMGEQLCAQGPMFYLPAALSFYRALRVYPSPVELIMIYQKTVPEPVFKIIMELTQQDVSVPSSTEGSVQREASDEDETSPTRSGPPSEASSQEWDRLTDPGSQPMQRYYDVFPPKSMNVSVQPAPGDASKVRKILVAEKDFEPGDVIYKERPIVAVLDPDLQAQGTYCSHCFRYIQGDSAIRPESDRLGSVYCSEDCQAKAKIQSHNLLFGLDPVLPPELDHGQSQLSKPAREAAQSKFTDYIKKEGRSIPLLSARFVARQIAIETAKMLPIKTGPVVEELAEASIGGTDYSLYDHIERLRFVEGKASESETKLLCDVLGAALPGLEQSVTEERLATYQGKLAYNAIGVCYSGGRDDKPDSGKRPEEQERMRTPHGTSRQIGSGLYPVSAYITHSCAPSASPSFSSGTSELSLIASKPIKKGEEITMAYVDVSQHPDETPEQAKRRRRIELARGWRFKCECERCLSEATDGNESDLGVEKDESKVEDVVNRVEAGAETYLTDKPQ